MGGSRVHPISNTVRSNSAIDESLHGTYTLDLPDQTHLYLLDCFLQVKYWWSNPAEKERILADFFWPLLALC